MSHKTTDKTSGHHQELLVNRRTYYNLNSSSPISDSEIKEIFGNVLLNVPSAFNTQSTRIVLALGDHHRKVWDTVAAVLKAKMGEERFEQSTKGKVDAFRKAHGTALFYTDPTDLEPMKEKFASYKDHFDPWAEHSQGMHQLAAWVELEAEGLGANLQHYNPIIDDDIAKLFDVPKNWYLRAQLVFGGIEGGRPDSKPKKDLQDTLKVFS